MAGDVGHWQVNPARAIVPALLAACVALPGFLQAAPNGGQSIPTAVPSNAAHGSESVRLTKPDLATAALRVVDLTNVLRRRHQLADVLPDSQLANAARYFADFMARTDKFAHTADGTHPSVRARKFGYDYCVVAENIAYEFSTAGFTTDELARNLFQGWENSAGHRKNMLDANVTQTAVAVSFSARTNRYYAVQLFGRPQSESIKFSVANRAGVTVEYQIDEQVFSLPQLATRTHQICRRPQLKFRGETLQPGNGQRLVIVNEQGSVRLQVQ